LRAAQRAISSGPVVRVKAAKECGLDFTLAARRVGSRAQSALELTDFLARFDFLPAARLRAAHVHVQCAREGLNFFDLPRSHAGENRDRWRPLPRWLAKHA